MSNVESSTLPQPATWLTVPIGDGSLAARVGLSLTIDERDDDGWSVLVAEVQCADREGAVWVARSSFSPYRLIEVIQTALRPPVYLAAQPALAAAIERSAIVRGAVCYPDSRDSVRLTVGDTTLSWQDVWAVRLKHARATFDIAPMPADVARGLVGDLVVRMWPDQLAGRPNGDLGAERFVPALAFGITLDMILNWNDLVYNEEAGWWDEVHFPFSHRGAEFVRTEAERDPQVGVSFERSLGNSPE